jgi:ubiquinol-cytochrome c reductase iron-sulfur subunit
MLDDLRAQTVHTWSQRPIPADRPAFFVYSLKTPTLGCVAVYAPRGAFRYAPERVWQGGFYDPCHFAEWDYAGRTIKQYPDQDASMRAADLEVPAFEFRAPGTLRLRR